MIARLRNRTFASLDEAVLAVRECNAAYNARPFQKRQGSRDSVFAEVEAAELRPLPDVRCDVAGWVRNRSVNLDSHVVRAKNRYSVPHRYVGCKVDLRVGESTLSIYHAGERIAAHRLKPACVVNDYSTDEAHMPDSFLKPEWDDARVKGRAKRVGPNCAAVAGRIFDRAKVKEQAHNPALSALNLSKKHGEDRLEAACGHALPRLNSPRCRRLKAILDSGLDRGAAEGANGNDGADAAAKGHVRGAGCCRD